MNVASKLTQSAATHAIIAGSGARHAMTPVLTNNLQTIYSKNTWKYHTWDQFHKWRFIDKLLNWPHNRKSIQNDRHLSVCLFCMWHSVCIVLSICRSVYQSIYIYIIFFLSIILCISLVYIYISFYIYRSVYINHSMYLSIHLSFYQYLYFYFSHSIYIQYIV